MIYGHADIAARLTSSLPPVALFTGPKSVGKWHLANEIRKHYGITGTDFFSAQNLNADRARDLVTFLNRGSTTGHKIAIVRLDKSSSQALNALLKALEELATGVHVILIAVAAESVPETIRSRSEHYPFGTLSPEDLKSVLIAAMHIHPEAAERLAVRGGTVAGAIPDPEDQDDKQLVVRALHALHERSVDGLDSLAPKWTDRTTELLRRWCSEALTGRWLTFDPAESEIQETASKLRILLSLGRDIRPKLVVRASLMTLLTQGPLT